MKVFWDKKNERPIAAESISEAAEKFHVTEADLEETQYTLGEVPLVKRGEGAERLSWDGAKLVVEPIPDHAVEPTIHERVSALEAKIAELEAKLP